MVLDNDVFHNLDREMLLHPSMTCLWNTIQIGIVIVDGNGVCNYMNPLQKRIDGFEHISVIGEHIDKLYLANEEDLIPTLQCLYTGQPLLQKTYWYKTRKNELFKSDNDFLPLFKNGKPDGVISFTVNTSTNQLFYEGHDKRKRPKKNKSSRVSLFTFDRIIGQDKRFQETIMHAMAATKTDSAAMIWGESGVGKELFAQSIHSGSSRHAQPFIPVNCAAIPDSLLEGILFGTTKGAYTDATDKAGLFEDADGGTIFLDELNSMPMGLQAKLLRVIQEKTIRRVGSLEEHKVDVKMLSSLNEHPLKAVERGVLRRDLYYRLAVIGISIPPLRQRKDDIPLLIHTFLSRFTKDTKQQISIADDVMNLLLSHEWPGNVRELMHVIEGAIALLGDGRCITRRTLPVHFLESIQKRDYSGATPVASTVWSPLVADEEIFDFNDIESGQRVPLKSCVKEYEERCIRKVLRLTGGNVAKAGRILEMSPSSLHYRIKALGIM